MVIPSVISAFDVGKDQERRAFTQRELLHKIPFGINFMFNWSLVSTKWLGNSSRLLLRVGGNHVLRESRPNTWGRSKTIGWQLIALTVALRTADGSGSMLPRGQRWGWDSTLAPCTLSNRHLWSSSFTAYN